MNSQTRIVSLIHFVIHLLGSVALLWIIQLLVNAIRFNWSLKTEHYATATLLVLIAAMLELITRSKDMQFLGGLSNRQRNDLSQRQSLFTLVLIFGFMVMSRDNGLSRTFLAIYFLVYTQWTLWVNRFGFRLLIQTLYSNRWRKLIISAEKPQQKMAE